MAQFYDDLKVLESALYQPPALAAFLEVHLPRSRNILFTLCWQSSPKSPTRTRNCD